MPGRSNPVRNALVIAPATANVLAKLARGIADDFLTTLYLATTAPVVVAPAMNVNMWENAATQANIETLKARGYSVVEPDSGYLACGMVGAGRLAAASAVVSDITYLARQVAAGTAGKLPYVSGNHTQHLRAVPKAEMQSRFYLRFSVADKPGVLAGISGILSKFGVSIAGIYQPEHAFQNERGTPIMILTHLTREGIMERALKEIARRPFIRSKTVLLRIEE